MALEPITAVTPDLLAMTWASQDAARTWFRRRQTDPNALGLEMREYPSDKGLRVRVVTTDKPARDAATDPEAFEAWAIVVDSLLQDANEDPETDKVLEALFAGGHTVESAFDDIIARRGRALEAQLDSAAEPGGEPGAEPGGELGAELELTDEERLELAGTDDGTGPELIEDPVVIDLGEGVPIVEGPEHPGVTAIRIGNLTGEAAEHAERMLAKSMEPVGDDVALSSMSHPQTPLGALSELHFLTLLSAELGVTEGRADAVIARAEVMVNERLIALGHATFGAPETDPQAPKQAPQRAGPEGSGEAQKAPSAAPETIPETITETITETPRTRLLGPARAAAITAALEAKEGASAREMQTLLGWESLPSPYSFKEWARSLDRLGDLTDLGLVEGERRWCLLVRRR